MKFLDDEGLKEAYSDANQNTWSKAELDAYIYAGMRDQDYRGGMEKSLQKGIQKGENNKEIEAVIGFYENGVPVPVIAKSLKITEDKATEIIESHKK